MHDDAVQILRVGVLVDLERGATAGGHVKCWERIALAATRLDLPVDLSIHVQGEKPETVELSERVRYIVRPPLLSTARWRSFEVGADHTDLAPVHFGVLRDLVHYDVLHTTDAFFSYARTAALVSRLWNKALVTSIHTDTPSYTRLYAERILRRLIPSQAIATWLVDRKKLPERFARRMRRKLERHVDRADWALIGERTAADFAAEKASILRRGIDRSLFTPTRRNRAWLCNEYSISPTTKIVLFVGRLDEGKGVRILTQALKILASGGGDIVGIFAGRGPEADWIKEQLGANGRVLGQVAPDRLADIYASANLFALPSEIEVSPNVVLEAKASGLVPLVAPNGGGKFVSKDGDDGLIVTSREASDWAHAMSSILADDERRSAISISALRDIECNHPTWEQVVVEDLYPIWLRCAASRRGVSEEYVQTAPAYSGPAS